VALRVPSIESAVLANHLASKSDLVTVNLIMASVDAAITPTMPK
jgi:hypothetical protein